MKSKIDWIVLFTVLLIGAVILGSILYFQPFYGLMDDANNLLSYYPRSLENGFFKSAWLYAMNDISWGMFRVIYPMMVYFLYGIATKFGSTAFFFVNAIFVFFVYALNARVLGKILQIKARYILLCSAAFFYAYDLINHPSLQEKLILLFGAPLLWISANKNMAVWKKVLGISIFTIFGVLSKASFCIYIGVSFIALLSSLNWTEKKKESIFLLTYVFSLNILSVLFLAYITSRGQYTTGNYSLAKVLPNLKTIDGFMFLLPIIIYVVLFFRFDNLKSKIEIFIPFVGTVAFLVIFLPWGIAAYIQTVIAPLFCAMLVQVAFKLFGEKYKIYWVAPLIVLALTVASYRSYSGLSRLADLGKIINMAPELAKNGIHDLEMPCWEGAGSIGGFFLHFKNEKIEGHPRSDWSNLKELDGRVALFDRAMCPLPNRVAMVSGCTAAPIFESSFSKGFKVVKLHCSESK